MARRLRDDEIRWVLNLDAKGVQGEFQKLSSATAKLTQENKNLAGSNRETEKEMKGLERQMKKLEKTNQTNTKTYRELRRVVNCFQKFVPLTSETTFATIFTKSRQL